MIKIRNLNVSAQLLLVFTLVFFFVIALGLTAYYQANLIHNQMATLYEHPLQVRRAIGKLQTDVETMRLHTRDLMLAKNESERNQALLSIRSAEEDGNRRLEEIRERFTDNEELVDSALAAFTRWKAIRENNIHLIFKGEIELVKQDVKPSGETGAERELMMKYISRIDQKAVSLADILYTESDHQNRILLARMVGLIVFFLFVLIYVMIALLKSLRNPVYELTKVAEGFRDGNLAMRSTVDLKNEFGALSSTFNSLADKIETEIDILSKTERLNNAMQVVNDSHTFFRGLLPILAELTGSQLAAVYLLAEDKRYFHHYESVGLSDGAITHLFDVDFFQGEFGASLISHEIEIVKSIPLDTRFVFQTVSGNIVPREIITIPILSENVVVAMFSIAAVRKYNEHTLLWMRRVFDILTARVLGVLLFRQLKRFSFQLEEQNNVLDKQRKEKEKLSVELMAQNRELELQKYQLDEVNRLKTSFLSNVSHELRTPLNSIITLSGVLHRKLLSVLPGEEVSYLEVIERNGKHLLVLINEILDISRIESGKVELDNICFNPSVLTEEIVEMIRPQATQKGIVLKRSDQLRDLKMNSDPDKFKHILQNLISNAVKFTVKGEVNVELEQKGHNLNVIVTDTGIGIEHSNIEKIFDEFRQAESSTSRRFGGTGLGLSIARKYARLLGGDVFAQSQPGVGSIFTLSLPLKPLLRVDNLPCNERQENEAAASHFSSVDKTLLIVGAQLISNNSVQDQLEKFGFNVISIQDNTEVIKVLERIGPDLLILNLLTPEHASLLLDFIKGNGDLNQIPVLCLCDSIRDTTQCCGGYKEGLNLHFQESTIAMQDLKTLIDFIINESDFNYEV